MIVPHWEDPEVKARLQDMADHLPEEDMNHHFEDNEEDNAKS